MRSQSGFTVVVTLFIRIKSNTKLKGLVETPTDFYFSNCNTYNINDTISDWLPQILL